MLHNNIAPFPTSAKDALALAQERRTAERYVTVLKIGRVEVDGRDHLCLIRNMSSGGAKLTMPHPLSCDQEVLIEIRSDRIISGIVRWADGHIAGIQFNSPVNVQEILQTKSTRSVLRKLPRAPRFEALGRVHLERDEGLIYGDILNISLQGLCIESDNPPLIDENVVVRIAGLPPRRASVRWVSCGMVGLHFDLPMGYSELSNWLEVRHLPLEN